MIRPKRSGVPKRGLPQAPLYKNGRDVAGRESLPQKRDALSQLSVNRLGLTSPGAVRVGDAAYFSLISRRRSSR